MIEPNPPPTGNIETDFPFEVRVSINAPTSPKVDEMHDWVLAQAPDHRMRLAMPERAWCFRFKRKDTADAFIALFGGKLSDR